LEDRLHVGARQPGRAIARLRGGSREKGDRQNAERRTHEAGHGSGIGVAGAGIERPR
jgi:hypothetical protein